MEKAFSVYKNIPGAVTAYDEEAKKLIKLWEKDPAHTLSGQNVSGGWDFMPLSIITGEKSESFPIKYIMNCSKEDLQKNLKYFTFSYKYNAEENNLFDYINNMIKEDKILTAGTKNNIESSRLRKTVLSHHAYSIQGTQIANGKKYIILKNPHMDTRMKDPIDYKMMEIGTVKLELSDFVKCFRNISKINLKK